MILDYDWQTKNNEKSCKPVISCETMPKKNVWKLLECKKMASRKIHKHFLQGNFLMFVCEFCEQFLKNSVMQIHSKLNLKPYDYLQKFIFLENIPKDICMLIG